MGNIEALESKPASALTALEWQQIKNADVNVWHRKLEELYPFKPKADAQAAPPAASEPKQPAPDPAVVQARRELDKLFEDTNDRVATEAELKQMVALWHKAQPLPIGTRLYIHLLGHERSSAEMSARFEAIESSIQAVKDALGDSRLAYRGIWQPGASYQRGDCATDRGSVWYSVSDENRTRPGAENQQWTLMVKSGRDGRDAR